MSRAPVRILLLGLTGVVIAATAGLLWHVRERTMDYFTDAGAIRRPVTVAQPRDVLWTDPVAVPGVNTDVDEYEPRLSSDGLTLFFVRGRAGRDADIYTSTRTPAGWSEPAPLGDVNTPADELGPEPAADGRTLYFYSNRAGGHGGYDLWVTHRNDDGWNPPVNLGPFVNSPENEYGPAVAPDGSALYFASNRPLIRLEDDAAAAVTQRDATYDVYRVRLDGRGVGQPEPVRALNSPGNDGAPALSPSGDFIYLSSDRVGGEGGFDLYRARIVDGTFLTPINLGAVVNTRWDEMDPAISESGFRVHFGSNRPRANARDGDHGLYTAVSREVFRQSETFRAAVDWLTMLTWGLWLLAGILALLLLWLLSRITRTERFGKLSLIARCLVLSLLTHVALLFLLGFWGVGSSLSQWIQEGEGTRVVLVSSAAPGDLAAQIRGAVTEIELAAPMETASRQLAELPRLVPLAAPTRLTVARVSIETQAFPTPADAAADAAPQPEETPDPEPLAPAEAAVAVNVDVPRESGRAAATHEAVATPSVAAAPAPGRQTVAVVHPDATTEQIAFTPPSPRESIAAAPSESLAEDARVTDAPTPPIPETVSGTISSLPIPRAAMEPDLPLVPERAAARTTEATRRVAATAATVSRHAAPSRAPDTFSTASAPVVVAPASSAAVPARGSLAATDQFADAPTRQSLAVAGAPTTASIPTPDGMPIDLPDLPVADGAIASEARTTVSPVVIPQGRTGRATTVHATPSPTASTPVVVAPASSAAVPARGSLAATDQFADAPTRQSLAVAGAPTTTSIPTPDGMPIDLPDLPVGDGAIASEARTAVSPVVVPQGRTGRATTVRHHAEMTLVKTHVARSAATPARTFLGAPVDRPHGTPIPLAVALPGARSVTRTDGPDFRLPSREDDDAMPRTGEAAVVVRAPASPTTARKTPARLTIAGRPNDIPLAGPPPRPAIADATVVASLFPRPLTPIDVSPGRGLDLPQLEVRRMAVTGSIDIDLEPSLRALMPPNPHPQRAPEVRKEIVETMGGSRETERAVAIGIDWLARHQSLDGRWDSDDFDRGCGECVGRTRIDVDVALTGLSLLCFLATDHTHIKDGTYRAVVGGGLRWIVEHQEHDGNLAVEETMYSHGIATIALAEAYGMTGDEKLRAPLEAAVDFIIRGRNRRGGGWRYAPQQAGDTSVLGWQIMALSSARTAGLDIDPAGFASARRWLENAAAPDRPGLFVYQPGRLPSAAMTAEGMFVKQLLGHAPHEPEMRASVDYLLDHPPDWDDNPNTYYWYYATLALFQHQGSAWKQWNELVKEELLAHQATTGRTAGSWAPNDQWSNTGGRIYQTAIAILTLEVYYRYLPRYIAAGEEDPGPRRRGGG